MPATAPFDAVPSAKLAVTASVPAFLLAKVPVVELLSAKDSEPTSPTSAAVPVNASTVVPL